jgi:hypothetical protein
MVKLFETIAHVAENVYFCTVFINRYKGNEKFENV